MQYQRRDGVVGAPLRFEATKLAGESSDKAAAAAAVLLVATVRGKTKVLPEQHPTWPQCESPACGHPAVWRRGDHFACQEHRDLIVCSDSRCGNPVRVLAVYCDRCGHLQPTPELV